MKKKDRQFLMAAVAGISMGLRAPAVSAAEEPDNEVRCWGVNGCGAHAKCSVKADDLKAFQELLGAKEYQERFGKSRAHSCGAHAKCGASNGILNWVPATPTECQAQGGYVLDEAGAPKKKVARKA